MSCEATTICLVLCRVSTDRVPRARYHFCVPPSQRPNSPPRPASRQPAPRPTDDDRLGRLEVTVDEMRQNLEVQFRRIAAIQAQLDRMNSGVR